MASVPYEIAQGKTLYISNPMLVAAIGGDNATPFYLNFPQLPPGLQWVFPYTYNFMYPVEPPQQLRVDASKVPRGYPVAPTSSEVALLTAWDSAQLYDAGTRSAATPTTTLATAVGTLINNFDTLQIPAGGASYVTFGFTAGTLVAGSTLSVEGTDDDTTDNNWKGIPWYGLNIGQSNAWQNTGINGPVVSFSQLITAMTAGLSRIRIRLTPVGGGQAAMTFIARATSGGIAFPFGQQPMSSSVPVTMASDQSTVPVSLATTQKPLAYQNRVEFAATALTIATVAVEAMLTLVPVRAGVAGAGVTSIPVTAGKRLRITQFSGEFRNNAAAAHVNQFTLKTNPGGAAVVGSPTLNRIELYSPAALANAGQQQSVPLPDGIEFAGTDQIGVSHLSDAAAIGFGTVNLNGFEYTP